MNERMKELLLQNKDNFSYSVTAVDGKVYIHGSEDNLEKFAELIIRECAKQCEPESGIKYSPNSFSTLLDCESKILQHFGIE